MAFLLYFTAIVLSGIAAYYSVIGLIAIFSAAAIPVAIMGGSLEVAKLVVASWLYRYWRVIPLLMRGYFITALLILMLITSMGIFGFLSKAHNDQNLISGDVLSKIAIYDEKIKIAKENIDANRRSLKQMDEAVDQTMGRSTSESGADKAVQIRRSQARERTRLLKDIEAEQKKITELNEARAPIAAEVRKVEAEVGPLKYIAALIYDDTTDTSTLERAVRWLIIMLIVVFDPLAVLMLIAANLTQIRTRKEETPVQSESTLSHEKEITKNDTEYKIIPDQAVMPVAATTEEQQPSSTPNDQTIETITSDPTPVEEVGVKEEPRVEQVYLKQPWVDRVPGIKFPPQVYQEEITKKEPIHEPEYDPLFDQIKVEEQAIIKIEEFKQEEQTDKDKSISEGFIAKPISVDDEVQRMIDIDDQQGLEQVYKKIVKELAKQNRLKSTHWGPIKNNKNG
jgi:hypothetical protein